MTTYSFFIFRVAFFGIFFISLPSVSPAQTIQGPSSSRSSYVLPQQEHIHIHAILSGGDSIHGYRFAGIPDGLGAYDNEDGTFTVLINHELHPYQGIKRRHGANGAFVSKWIITKPGHTAGDFKVLKGEDFIQNVQLWDPEDFEYQETEQARFIRLCSATLLHPFELYEPKKKIGTKEALFFHGEESDKQFNLPYGRAFATTVEGADAGTTYELPRMGNMSFENVVPSPYPHKNTLVALLDDSSSKTSDTLGEVYFYIGTKRARGLEIERAGLTNGFLYGLSVDDLPVEDAKHGLPKYAKDQTTFKLALIGDISYDNGRRLFDKTKANNALGITKFLKPEDGHWDPTDPHTFYFVTSGTRYDSDGDGKRETRGPGRLWRIRFPDIKFPRLGGKITCLLKGREGVRHLDNMTVSRDGLIYIQEDMGSDRKLPRIWEFHPGTRHLREIAAVDPKFFHKKGSFFITDDVETSGIISMEDILGKGWFLATVQAHISLKTKKDPFDYSERIEKELVEDSQLIAIHIKDL